MSIVTYVKVENFRSIRSAELTNVASYSPVVGINSAGKSNLLRALNLFFNGYLDEDRRTLNLATDFSSHAPKRKKKSVSITVGLRLGGEFNVRGQERSIVLTESLIAYLFGEPGVSLPINSLSLNDLNLVQPLTR